ncbi:MAG: GNAT family N-acetyltransferase [Pseudomonadota bacterium]
MSPDDLAQFAARALSDTTRAWSVAEFADLLAAPHTVLTTRPHAFALGRVIADEAELLLIATDPAHRRVGIGRVCLTAFEAACANRGATELFLEVSVLNAAARALYTAAGYTLRSERHAYYQTPAGGRENALVLHKALTTPDPT